MKDDVAERLDASIKAEVGRQRAMLSNVVSFLVYLTLWLSFAIVLLSLSAAIAVNIFRGLTHLW